MHLKYNIVGQCTRITGANDQILGLVIQIKQYSQIYILIITN